MQVQVILEGKTLNATSTNISEGGIALMLREAMPKGAAPRLKFSLPGTNIHLEVEAEVTWSNVKGLADFVSWSAQELTDGIGTVARRTHGAGVPRQQRTPHNG